ncbi:hypothetical protein HY642_01150 [Candidatus Woesearchaeota archaeon]|nr:hypothetical protein [Candidatus Woesearchaeota archaeon]
MRIFASWAFVIGVLLAVIAGLSPQAPELWIVWLLIGLGTIVGLLNITEKEAPRFLVAVSALLLVTSSREITALSPTVSNVVVSILLFAGPAALVVSLRRIWRLARD